MLSAHKSDDVMVSVDSTSSLYLIVQSYECSTIMRWVWVVTISKMPACAYRHVLIEISAFFDRTFLVSLPLLVADSEVCHQEWQTFYFCLQDFRSTK